ncbi:MAG: ShlB/FhaC/HecB family hemolysin secretion/activation protein [Steroidobacteraceae bacterium]
MRNTRSPNLGKSLFLLTALVALVGTIRAQVPAAGSAPEGKAAAPENYFDIHEYRVLGNTVLPNREIETVLYPLLGDHKTLKDVEAARSQLEKTYHDRGYGTVFVDIPEQDVTDKVVRLKVTEGRLHEVRIAGARYYSERKILAAVPAATAGTVPNLLDLQSQISAVSVQSADRNVVPILKAGPIPGTVDLSLKVDDHLPFHGSIETDNQNTPDTKPLRSTVSLSYDNLFQNFDSLSAQYQVSPQDTSQVSVFAANYAWGAPPAGVHPSVFFIDSNSNVPTVSTLGVIGKGQIIGTRFAFWLGAVPSAQQSLTLGVDYKHFDETINLASSSPVATPISYTNLSAAYAGMWASNVLTGTLGTAVDFGPTGLPNSPTAFADKCFQCQPNYWYLKLDGSLVAHLPKGFQLILRTNGQFAVEPLITNEEFSLTGADGVRGYLEAEVLATKGFKGSVQVQSPVAQVHAFALGDLFLFYDAGRANVIDPLPNQQSSFELSSWGAGVHVLPRSWLTGSLTWADPLKNGPITPRGDSRFLFVVRGAF